MTDETYGGLWVDPPLPIGDTDWSAAWLAIVQGVVAGIALTEGDQLKDLWVLASGRKTGVGGALLSKCELEILERGYTRATLRVVSSNHKALRFYARHGWCAQRVYPHETLPILMTEMAKQVHA